jgi:hypothetical protein
MLLPEPLSLSLSLSLSLQCKWLLVYLTGSEATLREWTGAFAFSVCLSSHYLAWGITFIDGQRSHCTTGTATDD